MAQILCGFAPLLCFIIKEVGQWKPQVLIVFLSINCKRVDLALVIGILALLSVK